LCAHSFCGGLFPEGALDNGSKALAKQVRPDLQARGIVSELER